MARPLEWCYGMLFCELKGTLINPEKPIEVKSKHELLFAYCWLFT